MIQQKFPEGWDADRVKRLLEHYDNITEEELVAEDEATQSDERQAIVAVPLDLLPAIRQLLATHKTA